MKKIVHPDGLPHPQRIFAFLAVIFTIVMAVLDGTIINVALPTIAQDQGASPAHAIWVVTAYQLAVVVSLLPMAALGEAIGFRKVYLGGIAVFGVASALCAMAPSIEFLAAVRLLQGFGGAALMSINAAVIRHIMPRDKLGRGISWIAMTVAVSAAAGPTIASAILAITTWHWLFLINVPVSIIALLIGFPTLPHTHKNGVKFDYISAILNVFTFGGLISALSSIGTSTNRALIGAQFVIAFVAGILMVRRQTARSAPMLPIDLLRRPVFACSMICSVSAFCAQFICFVSLPFFFHDVLGYGPVATGLLLTPWPVATAIVAPIAGRLSDRYSPLPFTGLGMAIYAIGLFSLPLMPAAHGDYMVIISLMLAGAGFGLFQSPNNRLIMTSSPRERSGGASGMLSTARLLGQSTGAALSAILISLSGGFDLEILMWTATGFALIAALTSVLRNHALRTGKIAANPA